MLNSTGINFSCITTRALKNLYFSIVEKNVAKFKYDNSTYYLKQYIHHLKQHIHTELKRT